MTYLGDFPLLYTTVTIPFGSFAAATGAPSVTTNFAAADVVIYKDGGLTQRTSAAGITVSTSFDGTTGLQMIVIDLSDNTDAGFYAGGHEYQVVVGPITVDSQTLTFPAACFSIERSLTARRLALTMGASPTGTVDTAGFAATNTQFEASDITEATTGHYIGRVALFTSGAMLAQGGLISAYSLAGGRGHFTVAAMTEAPANGVTFIII